MFTPLYPDVNHWIIVGSLETVLKPTLIYWVISTIPLFCIAPTLQSFDLGLILKSTFLTSTSRMMTWAEENSFNHVGWCLSLVKYLCTALSCSSQKLLLIFYFLLKTVTIILSLSQRMSLPPTTWRKCHYQAVSYCLPIAVFFFCFKERGIAPSLLLLKELLLPMLWILSPSVFLILSIYYYPSFFHLPLNLLQGLLHFSIYHPKSLFYLKYHKHLLILFLH